MNQSVENISNVLNRITEAIIALDNDWNFVYLNDEAAHLLQKPVSHFLGKNIWSEFPASIGDPFYNACYDAMRRQIPASLEEYIPDLDRWYEKKIYPSPDGLSILLKEIAPEKIEEDEQVQVELKKAEEEIRKSSERFSLVATATNDMIWDWNLLTDELWWNNNYNTLFGHAYSAKHDIGSWVSNVHPDDRVRVKDSIYSIIKNAENFWSAEYRYLKSDGTILHIYDRGYVMYDDAGTPYRMIGSMLNITDRIEAAQSIKESEEKYRTLVQQASDAIFIVDDTGRLYTVNPSACRMTQHTEEELLNMTIYDFSVKEDIEKNPYRFTELRQGHTVIIDRLMKRKDGLIFNVEINAKVLTDGRILVFARDITEKVKADELLKKSYKDIRRLAIHLTQVREEERKRIGREIHDELGQQLTAIKMDVAWIDKKITDNADPVKSKLKNIITLLDGSNQSVRRILSELSPGVIDDDGLPEALERQNRQFTATTGVAVQFSSSAARINLSQEIANCIFRVYQESLTNIMRYAQANEVVASLQLTAEAICLQVQDNGKGFDTEAVQSKKSFGILGMKERVLSQKGEFKIESEEGKGTKVTIKVPYLS
jgi:PAS domain S-box-containing protein